jgi:hypothetical protein
VECYQRRRHRQRSAEPRNQVADTTANTDYTNNANAGRVDHRDRSTQVIAFCTECGN